MSVTEDALKAHQERLAISTAMSPDELAEQELANLLGEHPDEFRITVDCDTEWRAEHEGMSFRVTKWAGEEYRCYFLTIFDAWHSFQALHELGRLLDVGTVRIKGVTAKIIERDATTE